MKIVVLDGYTLNPGDNPWNPVEAHGKVTVYDRTPEDKVIERAKDAEIVLTNKTLLTRETLDQLPKLTFISVLATGFNVVDIDAAAKKGIPVSNVPVYGTDSVAQFVFAKLLNLIHRAAHHDELIRKGQWAETGDFSFWDADLIELRGKKMGIVGFGRIGRRTGEVAHAFGMDVLAYDAFKGSDPDYQPFAWRELDELFKQADVVSLHCPQTPDNAEFINKELLSTMKNTAYFINTARGGLVKEQDLADALNKGVIAGASIDVVSKEPIEERNPLLSAKNCVLTPHMSWATLEARTRLMATTGDNIKAFLDGKPVNMVNQVGK